MAIKSIDLSWIVVSDLKKAKELFVDTLGFKAEVYEEQYGWMELVAPEGGMRLGVAMASDPSSCTSGKPGSNAVVTMTVDNLEESIKEFKTKGVTFQGDIIEIPGHVKLIFFTDADGNRFQLVQNL